MGVLHDATTTKIGSHTDFDHTPVGTPTLAIFASHKRDADGTADITAVSYGGVAMTFIAFIGADGDTTSPAAASVESVEFWKLENPASGVKTVSITMAGTTPTREAHALTTFTGTALSSATGTVDTDNDNGGTTETTCTATVTSETDGMVLDVLGTQEAETHTEDSGQTERWQVSDSTSHRFCGSTEPGAASVTTGWSWTTVTRFAYIALPIVPAATGPTAAVIEEGVGGDDEASAVNVTSYDAGATSHDLYRHTSTMLGDAEANGSLILTDFDPDIQAVDIYVDADTLYYWAVVSRDGGGDTNSNEINFRTAPARPTVLSEGVNQITFPEMDTDTDSDGGVDGFIMGPSGVQTVIYGVLEEAQRIRVTASTGAGGSSVLQWVDVTAGIEYTWKLEVKLANVVAGFTGKVRIEWFNGGYISGDEVSFTNTSFTDVSVTATAPTGATSAKARVTARTENAGDTGELLARHARFYRTDHLTETQAAVSWADNTGGLRGYIVLVDEFPGGAPDAGEESIVLYGLTPDTPITVKVLAVGPGGERSGWDETVEFTAEAPEPPVAAEVVEGTLAHFNFGAAIDPIRATGSVQRTFAVEGVANLVNRDGFLTEVHASDAPMEWLGSAGGLGALILPGASGDYVSTPDSVALSITGDIDIRVKVRMNDWTPGGSMQLNSKYGADGVKSWYFRLATSGRFDFAWTPTGDVAELILKSSTTDPAFTDGSEHWVRVTLDVDNGAAGNTVTFYTSPDGVVWTMLGTAVATAGTTSVFDGTAAVEVGAYWGGSNALNGKIYEVQIRDGIDGTVVASPDFTDLTLYNAGRTTLTDAESNVWTLQGNAGVAVSAGDILPTAAQALSLFAAGTNIDQNSFNFYSNWTQSDGGTTERDVAMAPNRKIEADRMNDPNAAASSSFLRSHTVADDSSYWCFSKFCVKDPDATAFVRWELQVKLGSPEVTGDGIDYDPKDGSFQLFGSPLTGGVIDLGWAFRVWCIIQNNGNGNTNLRSVIYPAYGTSLGVNDVAAEGSVVLWGHDIKNQPFLSPHVETSGAMGSHVARTFQMEWLAAPAAFVGYLALYPWMVAGAGGVPESYRLFSLGGDVGNLGEESFAVYLDGDTADKINAKLRNTSGSTSPSVTNAWEPGDLLEVYWKVASNGVVTVSAAVNWGTFVDSSPSGPLTLPTDWHEQVAALNGVVGASDRRGAATYEFVKFETDTTLTADDMRDLWFEAEEGVGSL